MIIRTWHHPLPQEQVINGVRVQADERELFNHTLGKYGFKEVLDLTTPTWSPTKTDYWELFKLKLDWFMVRNMKVMNYTVSEYISDHKPIEVQLEIP